ncbi:hypothetical protein C2E23DRAFT_721948 [Lenzites betulinus]|nr:hypothetical protein C2E23DRAFT_721948 [Lenzites betulinus]
MCQSDCAQELPVTFRPELYLQRRGWVLDVMRREGITEVLDIGCGEGELLSCLCNAAPWLAPPPASVLPPNGHAPDPHSDANDGRAEVHRDVLHPVKVAGLDIDRKEVEFAAESTRPLPPGQTSGLWHEPLRWEPLEVEIWEGSLAHVNPEFVDIECIVGMEVIEHLPEDVLQAFAPVVFGAYHPRVVLVTTPSYTFNARFTAPDAPREARTGWPDPTRRTSRIFRHHDHKFEWTAKEFQDWCDVVAEDWGYDVDIGGVGKAQEIDEWGRDDALGWASQVAAFKRREDAGWAERRAARVASLGSVQETGAKGGHILRATHQYTAHEAAHRPKPFHEVADLVVDKMVHFRETSMSLHELWFGNDVAIACGGYLEWLVHAIEGHSGLTLGKPSADLSLQWTVELSPNLHHLIPAESSVDSPPDVDEIVDLWDPFDEDVVKDDIPADLHVVEDVEETTDGIWEEQSMDWDKDEHTLAAHIEWGAPQGDWTDNNEWT